MEIGTLHHHHTEHPHFFATPHHKGYHPLPPALYLLFAIGLFVVGILATLFFIQYNPITWSTLPCKIYSIPKDLTRTRDGTYMAEIQVTFDMEDDLQDVDAEDIFTVSMCHAPTEAEAWSCVSKFNATSAHTCVWNHLILISHMVQLKDLAIDKAYTFWYFALPFVFALTLFITAATFLVYFLIYKNMFAEQDVKTLDIIKNMFIITRPDATIVSSASHIDNIELVPRKFVHLLVNQLDLPANEYILHVERPEFKKLFFKQKLLFGILVACELFLVATLLLATIIAPFTVLVVIAALILFTFAAISVIYMDFNTLYVITSHRLMKLTVSLVSMTSWHVDFMSLGEIHEHRNHDNTGCIYWGKKGGIEIGFECVSNYNLVMKIIKEQHDKVVKVNYEENEDESQRHEEH